MSTQGLALLLLEYLRPGCERIEIAGSIRRGKAEPKDIELIAIPRRTDKMQEIDIWGQPVGDPVCCDHLYNAVQKLVNSGGAWTFDNILKRNGPKYKRLRHWAGTGTCCDLFIVTPETWGAQFVIRTGPADFSHTLVTRALRLGMKQEDGRLWRTHRDGTKTVIETPEERDYFKALGLEWIEPEMRGKVAVR